MGIAQRWHILAALTFARTSMGFQFQSIAPLAPFVSSGLGLDNTQLGWLIGIYLLPGVVIALPGGLLGARYGDKRVTLIGLALMTGGGIWLASAETVAEADAARLASGVGGVILNVLLTKMVADWFEGKQRLLAMSVLINAWPIGIGLALFALPLMGEAIGWRGALAAAAALTAAGFAAVLFVYRAPAGAAQAAPAGMGLGVIDTREWRLLAIASIPWFTYNAAYQLVVSFLPSFLLETGSSLTSSGAMTGLNTAIMIASVQAGGVLLKRSSRPDLLCHAAIISWCASLLLLSSASLPLFWIVAGGIVAGIPAAAFVNLPAEFLRPESRGVGMGVFYTVYYVGCALVPGIAGFMSDLAGSTGATLWLAALLAFICVPVLIAFRCALRHPQTARA
ncbi:MAG TPA: MFS transporter [Burkholderiales bacterium]|nr:MFS transporter [Burkholderiales bacterium]